MVRAPPPIFGVRPTTGYKFTFHREVVVATQFGYFLIADITGYTQYLSVSELDHAQKTLTALLNLLIKHTKPPLVISRLAGDAVISYGLRASFVHGQTFAEILEDTYVSFRQQIELMVHNTTCTCNACRNIGALDLKFFVHFGEFGVQKLDAHEELVGSDVNLIHRLLKNRVTEETGFKAYTLYTDAAIRELGLETDGSKFIPHTEAYEHLGAVETWVQDMHPVWEARREALQRRIEPAGELFRLEADIEAPPEAIWGYFIRPEYFNALLGADRINILGRSAGRVAVGSVYQCYHGDMFIKNTVVGWHPFKQLVFDVVLPVPIPGTTALVEVRLEPTEYGTHLIEIIGKASGPLLGRIAGDAGTKAREGAMRGFLANFKARLETDLASRAVLPSMAALSDRDVSAAARASLAGG